MVGAERDPADPRTAIVAGAADAVATVVVTDQWRHGFSLMVATMPFVTPILDEPYGRPRKCASAGCKIGRLRDLAHMHPRRYDGPNGGAVCHLRITARELRIIVSDDRVVSIDLLRSWNQERRLFILPDLSKTLVFERSVGARRSEDFRAASPGFPESPLSDARL